MHLQRAKKVVLLPADNGLKYYDLEQGSGNAVKKGDYVSVRHCC